MSESELELELESFDLGDYIDLDAVKAIMINMFLAVYIPGACWSIYALIRCVNYYDMFMIIPRELCKEFKNGPAKKPEDPSWARTHSQDPSRARNHLQGLKDIGQAYIGEAYIVSRQGSFHKSLRK